MRTPTGAGRSTRRMRWTLLAAGLVAGTGCATLRATFAGYATGPDGIARPQQRLRQALVDEDYAKVLAWREDDALLRSLTTGVAAYYAKQFARSAAVLDTAAFLADDRITASLSKNGLSFLTNDMARPYQPRRTERLFIPYYAMLAYVQLREWEDAAVEARRLVGLLAQYGEDRDEAERAVHGAMQHLAGAVFERAGELNDARVAYCAAHELVPTLPERVVRLMTPGEGELLLVVERGFIAHRATAMIELVIGGRDRDSLRAQGDGNRRALARIVERARAGTPETSGGHSSSVLRNMSLSFGDVSSPADRDDDDDDHVLTVAYPALRRSARPWGGAVRLSIDDHAVAGIQFASVLDDASAVDARRERVGIATRAVTRAVAKLAVTTAIREKKGKVAGTLADVGASLLERADVRSWHLLPQELTLVRVRVPAGTRAVRVRVGDGWAERTADIGNVVVQAGELTIVPVRLWRDPAPSPGRGVRVVEHASTTLIH